MEMEDSPFTVLVCKTELCPVARLSDLSTKGPREISASNTMTATKMSRLSSMDLFPNFSTLSFHNARMGSSPEMHARTDACYIERRSVEVEATVQSWDNSSLSLSPKPMFP